MCDLTVILHFCLFLGPYITHGIFANGVILPNTAHDDNNIISLGTHSNDCFGNVTLCPDGVAFSLWFKPVEIFKTWSHLYQSTCFHAFLKRLTNGTLLLSIDLKNGTHLHRYESFPEVTVNVWHHLGITYSPKYGASAYYDGELQTGNFNISVFGAWTQNFALGCNNKRYCIRIIYDDLKFWKVWKNPQFMLWLWTK